MAASSPRLAGVRMFVRASLGHHLGVRFRVVREIARREIAALTTTPTWRAITGLLVIITVVGVLVVATVGGGEAPRRELRVGYVGYHESISNLQEFLADADRSLLDFNFVPVPADATRDDLQRAQITVVVAPPRTLLWERSVDREAADVLGRALAETTRAERAAELGLSDRRITALLAPVEIEHRIIGEDTQQVDKPSIGALGIGLALIILTFIGVQVYGSIVVTGVVKEKSDGVVEVLLAHVRTRELLLGKIAGFSGVAALQAATVVLAAAIVLSITRPFDLPVSVWAIAPLALAIFLLGFGFYATLLAVAGSLVSRIEDGQFIALPALLPLIASSIVGLSLVVAEPDALLSRLLSYVPFSSPVIMPIRLATGSAAAWELALSVILLLATAWWTVVLAGRIYESTLLRTGSRMSWREAIRLARRDPTA